MGQTSDEYAQDGGRRCPVCNSHSLRAKGLSQLGPSIIRAMSCGGCGASWNQELKTQGYYGLVIPNPHKNKKQQETVPRPVPFSLSGTDRWAAS